MGRFRKIFLVTAIAVPLSLIPVNCAKATAAGDAALLVQQILQFLNDWDFDSEKWKDYTEKFEQLRKITNAINNGAQAYLSIESIENTVKKIILCGEDAQNYIDYLNVHSDEIHHSLGKAILKNFSNVAGMLQTEIYNTIENIVSYSQKSHGGNQSTSVSPLEILKATDEALKEFANVINETCETMRGLLADLCLYATIDENCSENQKFLSMRWY